MVTWLMPVIFLAGYTLIALEHPLKINKTAIALLLGVVLWIIAGTAGDQLLVHLGSISEILFFLLGAMTIVELVDAHGGFTIITGFITTNHRIKLLWMISIITFFLSALLDNLTTAIVMVALLRKIVAEKHERWYFAGMVIIAANSGGAFSPIGDVTTIMLWIASKVTTLNIIIKTFIPSVLSTVIPLIMLSFSMKGKLTRPLPDPSSLQFISRFEQNLVFFSGIGILLFVPVFKTVTHLPPYMGILAGLGALWVMTEVIHRSKHPEHRVKVTIAGIIARIDTPSILFFLGILLAVAALESGGYLGIAADFLNHSVSNLFIINILIGLLSAVVDNVPLVAGAIGMYGKEFGTDHYFWEMLAYCAGTGGSILIIGSAAGVAVMGMEKMTFLWYLKKISLPALAGYFAGAVSYWLITLLF